MLICILKAIFDHNSWTKPDFAFKFSVMTYQKYFHTEALLVSTKCNFHFRPTLTHQILPSRARRHNRS